MTTFFTNEAVSLEKQINPTEVTGKADLDIYAQYEINQCAEWIKSNNLRKVFLTQKNQCNTEKFVLDMSPVSRLYATGFKCGVYFTSKES